MCREANMSASNQARPERSERVKGKRGVIEQGLANITGSLEQALFAEEIARLPGFLQRLDPRVKVISVLALLLAVSFSHSLVVIAGLYAFSLLLAYASQVPMDFFVKRVWLFMPFFTGIVAIPAIFSFITPGTPLVTLWSSPMVAITAQGVRTALFLLLRVGTSVAYAVLLVVCTPWNTLLKAFSVLRVPQVFILVLGMTHRYIFLLLHTANDMFLARQSRVVGQMSSADHRRWISASMGVLLSKSFHLSNEVYLAMLSRGYRGQARVMDAFQLRALDWASGAAAMAVAGVAIFLGR
jgi:cobalt/nickel transport system permease protein